MIATLGFVILANSFVMFVMVINTQKIIPFIIYYSRKYLWMEIFYI